MNNMNDLLEKWKQRGEEAQKQEHECKKCKDTGYLIKNIETGEELPSNAPIPFSSRDGYTGMYTCRCKRIKENKTNMQHSGISKEWYDRLTLDKFLEVDDTTRAMKQKSRDYIAYYPSTTYEDSIRVSWFGMFGKSGTGKTHLCVGTLQELLEKKGTRHIYFSYVNEMPTLSALKFNEEERTKRMNKLKTYRGILYIDDLFKFARNNSGSMDAEHLRIIQEIINYRYTKQLPVMISSEYTGKELIEIDEAIGGRIIEMIEGYAMKVEGDNRRLKRVNRFMESCKQEKSPYLESKNF